MIMEYSPRARQKLRNISSYIIGKLKNPTAAKNVLARIMKGCSVLKNQPLLGMPLERLTGISSDYRYIIIGNYLAVYEIREINALIRIVDIFDCRTDYIGYLLDY